MEKLSKINFRQGKYILPAILYPLILLAGYFFIDLFHTETKPVEQFVYVCHFKIG